MISREPCLLVSRLVPLLPPAHGLLLPVVHGSGCLDARLVRGHHPDEEHPLLGLHLSNLVGDMAGVAVDSPESVRGSLPKKLVVDRGGDSADLGAILFSSYLGDDADNPRLEVSDGAAYSHDLLEC